MNRRQFVRQAAHGVSGLATAALVAGCAAAPAPDASGQLPHHLRGVLGDEAVRRIGHAYLAQTPRERDSSALLAALTATARRGRWLPWSAPTPDGTLIAADFEAGDTTIVDGWMLSVREARQCALFALATA